MCKNLKQTNYNSIPIIFVLFKTSHTIFYSTLPPSPSLENTPASYLCSCGLAAGQGHHFISFNTVHIPFLPETTVLAQPGLRDTACVHSMFIAADIFSPPLIWPAGKSSLSIHPSIRPSALRGWSLRTSQCPSLRRLSSSDAGWLCSSSA